MARYIGNVLIALIEKNRNLLIEFLEEIQDILSVIEAIVRYGKDWRG